MRYRLKDYPIKIISPDEVGIHLEIDENGDTAIDNALLKATAYYEVLNMPTIAGDSGLYIEGISVEKQPGLYVRRVDGKVLADDEMIDYYANLAKSTTNDCFIHCFTGIALITSKGTFTKEIKDSPLKLSSTPNSNRKHRGNPLDVISLIEDGRYFNDLTDEERVSLDQKGEQEFVDFIVSNVMN